MNVVWNNEILDNILLLTQPTLHAAKVLYSRGGTKA